MSETSKERFHNLLLKFVKELSPYVEAEDGQWAIKGFIDTHRRVHTISSDTKIVSKIPEIHLFPKFLEFAKKHGYKIALADHLKLLSRHHICR